MEIAKFFKEKTQIARVFEIPVRIDNRLYLVIFLMSVFTAISIPAAHLEDPLMKFLFGLLTTIIFFVSIFLHELGHSLMAHTEAVEVREIMLYPFGGLSRFKRPPDNAKSEFRIAIAGPAVSFLLSIIFLAAYFIADSFQSNLFALLFSFLFILNGLITVFNLFPGYPLDGGRVLRAFLWQNGKDINDATVLTGRAGQIIGAALVVIGLIIAIFQGSFFMGTWIAVMGFFLFDSAAKIIKETNKLEIALVKNVMSAPLTLLPTENIQHFVDTILPNRRYTSFLVAQERNFYGILALEDIKNLDKNEWHQTEIQKIMRPIKPEYFVEPETPLNEAKEIMRQNGVGIVGVIDEEGHLVGYLQKGKIRRKLK
jgi:Zn-dependent protease/CBS domain-containing protein